MDSISRWRKGASTLVILLAVATLAACSSPTTGSGSTAAPSGAGEVDLGALATGDYGTPPDSAPTPETGKSVWIVSCGQSAIGCSVGAAAAQEAAESLGWDAQVCDGKLNDGGAFAACVRQGIAAGVDGIVTEAIDCNAIKEPLQEAKTAGIATVNFWGFDCDEGATADGAALFTASVQPSEEYPTNEAYQTAIGKARADWIIARSGGEAEVIELDFKGTNIGAALSEGFAEGMSACPDCTVHTVDVTHQTFATTRQIIESALLKYPEAEWISIPLDSLVLSGSAQAVTSSPNRENLALIGGEGLAPNLDLVRDDQGQSAAIGQPIGWYGYGAIDTMNRVFAGEVPVAQGMSFQAVDSENNLPAEGGYVPPVDYVAAYQAAWGK
ncbi:sugar ABC transporter substrate-binding protein [Herbiconiux ginsengi]|uniref:Monosaccharide ABC transporter substrate-binding protein, CUT2 family n=1 Tax=Herbiconiux ginsengi TaxID=381665 RepID=A0A1H3TUZ3_9MICO|nr:substrate-binding domain-containing protein [Herbiconiux ginsengi]SDZ53858.1 monosaccharide ABC transporter substrate-binding protein, CUT2 family [Herbiconiux ginsengi]